MLVNAANKGDPRKVPDGWRRRERAHRGGCNDRFALVGPPLGKEISVATLKKGRWKDDRTRGLQRFATGLPVPGLAQPLLRVEVKKTTGAAFVVARVLAKLACRGLDEVGPAAEQGEVVDRQHGPQPVFVEAADEVIILDSHITGQMSRHVAGQFAGAKPTGIQLKFDESTPGRCFGDHGSGWGGTSITKPIDIIDSIDSNIAWRGMTILITETTGQNGTLFEFNGKGKPKEIPITAKAQSALNAISKTCEPSRVSAIYTAGAGGSARAGVTKYPIKITQAVHAAKAHLTVGGSPGYVLPGGGITFMVDVERVKEGSFYWTPTPATICPLEYTMDLKDYEKMGGHVEAMKPFKAKKPK